MWKQMELEVLLKRWCLTMLSQDSKFPPFPTTSPQKWIFFFLVPRNFLNGKVNENLTLLSDSESFFLVCFFIFLSNQKDHDTLYVFKNMNFWQFQCMQELLPLHYSEMHGQETCGEVISRPNYCDYNIWRSAQPPNTRNTKRKCGCNVPTFHVHTTDKGTNFSSRLLCSNASNG